MVRRDFRPSYDLEGRFQGLHCRPDAVGVEFGDFFWYIPGMSSVQPPTTVVTEKAVILSSDIRNYTGLTAGMEPSAYRDFTTSYYRELEAIFSEPDSRADEFNPYAGDAALALFKDIKAENPDEKAVRALEAARRLVLAAIRGIIPATRVGLFSGEIIKATYNGHRLDLGNSFSASSRLEQLCGFFGTPMLMGRMVAQAQPNRDYIVSIGKITPKGFNHPIHVFSLYEPGLYPWPGDLDMAKFKRFISSKNQAMEHFSGHALKGLRPDFSLAEQMLKQAATLFKEAVGAPDLATRRILEYISENPYPPPDFLIEGLRLVHKQGDEPVFRLSPLAGRLLAAARPEVYEAFVGDTLWEKLFNLEWIDRGQTIIRQGEVFDGVYHIVKGEVRIISGSGQLLAVLGPGDIFGEMAFFSSEGRRRATALAVTDLAVRKITGSDFHNLPEVIQEAFRQIALRRMAGDTG